MTKIKRFILWGSAGHAKVLAENILLIGGRVEALFDNNEVLTSLPGVPVFIGQEGFLGWIKNQNIQVEKNKIYGLAAIGGSRGKDRLKIQSLFLKYGVMIPVLIHPSAVISPSAHLGLGTQVMALSNIASESKLGIACIVNHRATIDHECKIGDGVHIGPGATLCGCVSVEDNVFIGAGAIILPNILIGKNSVIGAGTVVTKNISPGSTLVGNPARLINTISI